MKLSIVGKWYLMYILVFSVFLIGVTFDLETEDFRKSVFTGKY